MDFKNNRVKCNLIYIYSNFKLKVQGKLKI
jgi:hypothetical protein